MAEVAREADYAWNATARLVEDTDLFTKIFDEVYEQYQKGH